MKYLGYFKTLVLITLMSLPLMTWGVTKDEMEQARTIAAKSYLRYANDGSGYLDDLNPKTIEELEAVIKPKEKENIKAFKAIAVPSDYSGWTKEQLVEYWAVTAFKDKGLLEKGRGGRIRTRSLINKMEISAPGNQQQETKKADSTPASQVTDNTENQKVEETTDSLPALPQILPEETIEEDTNIEKATNYTWVYIMVLAILVAVVVALVVYAANVMKKNGGNQFNPNVNAGGNFSNEEKEHLESVISDKNTEIAILQKKLDAANRQISDLKTKLDEISAAVSTSSQRPTNKSSLRSIYLGRANSKGIFVRADRSLNIGQSIYILDTSDGFTGSFRVADSQSVWDLALTNPKEYLETACTGNDLGYTSGASRIVTESAGTAVFEGGCWRVIRKAKIRYV